MKHYLALAILCMACIFCFTSCKKTDQHTLKVAATSIPHAELLELIKPQLEEQNILLEILIIDDFNTPNRALADGEVDANFFQHLPFLEAQKKDFGYRLDSFGAVHLEPMALYSKKHATLANLPEEATIALPSDPSNQARALTLVEQNGLIILKEGATQPSILDIVSNPHHFKFMDMDSPLLPRSLEEVDAAIMSTNFALLGGLFPQKDALAIEDGHSRFANILVIRHGEENRSDLQALKMALTSPEVHQYILNHYHGAVIPAFN